MNAETQEKNNAGKRKEIKKESWNTGKEIRTNTGKQKLRDTGKKEHRNTGKIKKIKKECRKIEQEKYEKKRRQEKRDAGIKGTEKKRKAGTQEKSDTETREKRKELLFANGVLISKTGEIDRRLPNQDNFKQCFEKQQLQDKMLITIPSEIAGSTIVSTIKNQCCL